MNREEEEVQTYYYEEEEEKTSYIWLVLIIAALLLFFIVVGFTFSIYNNLLSGDKDVIHSSDILFQYSDVNGSKNGIHLVNASEMKDEVGKKLTGTDNTFEFSVSGNTRNNPCQYVIVLEKDMDSTISSSDVKIYLTKVTGGIEEEVFETIPVYSDLEDIVIKGNKYQKLYSVSLPQEDASFSQDYILRMWIREGATDYYEKAYSFKVHVLAEGAGE